MRTPNINSISYAPAQIPNNQDEFNAFLFNELRQIAAVLSVLASGHIEQTYSAPAKPRDGDIRFADGTRWNPGNGQGFYAYFAGAWHSLIAPTSITPRAPLKTAAPASPLDGDMVLADGTSWNPGSGRGIYAYYSTAWHFLG